MGPLSRPRPDDANASVERAWLVRYPAEAQGCTATTNGDEMHPPSACWVPDHPIRADADRSLPIVACATQGGLSPGRRGSACCPVPVRSNSSGRRGGLGCAFVHSIANEIRTNVTRPDPGHDFGYRCVAAGSRIHAPPLQPSGSGGNRCCFTSVDLKGVVVAVVQR